MLRAVASLNDPARYALYLYVRSAAGPVTREQAAAAVGLSRKVATFHLDRLVTAGLLVAEVDPATRHRPLGRLPKAYRPAPISLRVSIPDRRPLLLAEILLDALNTTRPGQSARAACLRSAEQKGRELAAPSARRSRASSSTKRALAAAEATLAAHGYEPIREAGDCLRLRNCPFQPLAAQATEIVCAINQRFITGMLDGLPAPGLRAALEPGAGQCCVTVRAH